MAMSKFDEKEIEHCFEQFNPKTAFQTYLQAGRKKYVIYLKTGGPLVCEVPADINVSLICDGRCWKRQGRGEL